MHSSMDGDCEMAEQRMEPQKLMKSGEELEVEELKNSICQRLIEDPQMVADMVESVDVGDNTGHH